MPQDQFQMFVSAARTYRKYVVNPSIKGMMQAFEDMGTFDLAAVGFSSTHAMAEQIWKASAL